MKGIEIGIIGGTHGMGKWFADFLELQGYRVHVSGRTVGMRADEMTACCQVVVISVPIGVTGEVIAQVGPLLGKDSLLMDLTSIKVEPVKAMLQCSQSEVIGCHPLFGPHINSLENHHIVLCPARSGKWLPWLKEVLSRGGASLVEISPERHDELMAIVQGLNHMNTILMGMVLSRAAAPASQLDQFTTPFFDIKSQMVKKIFTDNPQLYAEILCNNPSFEKMIGLYEEELAELKSSALRGNAGELTESMLKAASRLWPSGD